MSLIATRVQALRVDVPDYDKNMNRAKEYGALDFFVSQNDSAAALVTPELLEKARNSIGRTLQIPVINHDAGVTVSNARTCTVADSNNTSALITITFATFAVGFTMVPAQHMNNEIGRDRDFRRKFDKNIRALANALDVAAVAHLEANKTQVLADPLIYSFTGNVLKAGFEMREEVLGDLGPLFRANQYPGQLHVVGNAGIDSLVGKLAQKGIYNEVNKQLEYQNKIFHYTTNIVNQAGVYATAFVAEDGQVGVMTRSGRENLLGSAALGHEWDIVNIPVLNLPVDTHYYKEVGNQSTVAGEASADMNCNIKEFYGFAIDVAFVSAYNSAPATIANPILKVEIDRAIGNPMARQVIVVNDVTNPVHTLEGTP